MTRWFVSCVTLAIIVVCGPTRATEDKAPGMPGATENWPQFRGAKMDGLAHGDKLPDTWDTKKNVAWVTPIPGRGWGGAIVWGDKVFVTTAVGKTEFNPKMGRYAPEQTIKPDEVQKFMLLCLDIKTGKIIWERVVHEGLPTQPCHVKSNFAPETPCTDGERVYAYFGNIGLFCYDLKGEKLWEKKWPSVKIRLNWGTGASPMLYKDRLYIVNDNEVDSFIVALDKRTGEEKWKTKRAEKSNWAPPYMWETDAGPQLVTAGSSKSRGYDLDGKLLWELGPLSSVTVSAPIAKDGLAFVGSGYYSGGPLFAVKQGAKGNLTADKSDGIAWMNKKAAAYHTSPLIVGDRLYVILDQAFASCYDLKTGKVHYDREPLKGVGQFTSSPWHYNGKVFCLSEDGSTVVIEESPTFKLLHVNRLGESCLATPAIAQNRVFIRTLTKLYCIAQP